LPFDRLESFATLARAELPVIFLDSLPEKSAEGVDISSILPCFEAVSSALVAENLRARGLCHVSGEGKGIDLLRFHHVRREDKDIYLFSNEGIKDDIDACITLCQDGECIVYEPWENKLYKSSTVNGKLSLKIEKGNMLFVIFGDEIPSDIPSLKHESQREALDLRFEISLKDEGEKDYRVIAKNSELFDISAPDKNPTFSGEIRYKTTFVARDGFDVIDLGEVGEVCEAYLNGKYLGARINAPYKFDMSGAIREGENELEIIVKSNLAHRRRDMFSSFIQIPPSGILGEISLCKYEI
jgi:hypothetical protein